MREASKIAWKIMNYYFDNNQAMISRFRQRDLRCPLLTNQEISSPNKEQHLSISPHLADAVDEQQFLDAEVSKRITQKQLIVKSTVSKDLIFYSPLSYTYHFIKLDDSKFSISNIKNQLGMSLIRDLPSNAKVYWLLTHNPLSDIKFGKLIDMTGPQVTKYRTGKSKVGNMTLNHASKICKVYSYIIRCQLIETEHPLVTKKDIHQSFANAVNKFE